MRVDVAGVLSCTQWIRIISTAMQTASSNKGVASNSVDLQAGRIAGEEGQGIRQTATRTMAAYYYLAMQPKVNDLVVNGTWYRARPRKKNRRPKKKRPEHSLLRPRGRGRLVKRDSRLLIPEGPSMLAAMGERFVDVVV
jgi:hypothetical protein